MREGIRRGKRDKEEREGISKGERREGGKGGKEEREGIRRGKGERRGNEHGWKSRRLQQNYRNE